MAEDTKGTLGQIMWVDLTVPDAEALRKFYGEVVGWTSTNFAMGGYNDFVAHGATGTAVAGICHARGPNADLPPVWLIYISVADLSRSMESARRMGGEVIVGPRDSGEMGRFCVIKDPAGVVAALLEPKRPG